MDADRIRLDGQYLLGYHGCDKAVVEAILSGKMRHLKASANNYDWLGGGVYFWVDSPARALDWAKHPRGNAAARIRTPYIIGAVIQPGRCLNLTDYSAGEVLKDAYDKYAAMTASAGKKLAENKDMEHGIFQQRGLDCAVINFIHELRKTNGDQAYDSVLGVFEEGGYVYPGGGIKQKTHIQIAVRDVGACIKGYFKVPGFEG